jgi:hypothetical protein
MRHIESHLGGIMSDYINGVRISKFYKARGKIDSGEDIDTLVDMFAEALTEDIKSHKNGQTVSDCAFFAPRRTKSSETNKNRKDFVNRLTYKMYPPKSQDRKDIVRSYISYQKCLSALHKKFKEQEFEKIVEKEKFKISRLSEHKKIWCSLKNRPLSTAVTEPAAMPVDISSKEELDPFFDFLKKDIPVDHKSIEYNTEWIPDEECIKFNRGAIYVDGRMDLCKQVVGPLWINKLMESLVNNHQVKHFLLGNNIIGTVGAIAIKNFLLESHIPKIHTWYLAGNDIDTEGISHLVDGLQFDTDVREL